MKKSLLIVVVLLAVSALLAASAYTTAYVESPADFTVSDTDDALLAFEPGDHAAAYLHSGHDSNSKLLKINWAKGNDGEYGVQVGSIYVWEKLFKVTNNSENPVKVTISLDPKFDQGSFIYLKTHASYNWAMLASRWSEDKGVDTFTFRLDPGDSRWIDTKIDSMRGGLKRITRELTMIVEAKAIKASLE